MRYNSLDQFLKLGTNALSRGPIAIIAAEDLVEVPSTLTHHAGLGFASIVLLAPAQLQLPEDIEATIYRVDAEMHTPDALQQAINLIIPHAAGQWVYYCFNAEYLFFPFCETRSVGEMLAFHTEERRDAMLTYVVDLYSKDLGVNTNAVCRQDAQLDKSGYYALARYGADGHPKDRQLNFYGGLRWRFEEHVPKHKRRIDRISLFKAAEGLRMQPDHTFNVEEYNTYACPWHHSLTASVCSFRTAKALKTNPGSTFDIHSFNWHNSTRFEWSSQQLLDLGLMEPGQWF